MLTFVDDIAGYMILKEASHEHVKSDSQVTRHNDQQQILTHYLVLNLVADLDVPGMRLEGGAGDARRHHSNPHCILDTSSKGELIPHQVVIIQCMKTLVPQPFLRPPVQPSIILSVDNANEALYPMKCRLK